MPGILCLIDTTGREKRKRRMNCTPIMKEGKKGSKGERKGTALPSVSSFSSIKRSGGERIKRISFSRRSAGMNLKEGKGENRERTLPLSLSPSLSFREGKKGRGGKKKERGGEIPSSDFLFSSTIKQRWEGRGAENIWEGGGKEGGRPLPVEVLYSKKRRWGGEGFPFSLGGEGGGGGIKETILFS